MVLDPTTGFDTDQIPFDPNASGGLFGFLGNAGQGIGHFLSGLKQPEADPRYPTGLSPWQSGLAGMAQGFGAASMPSRLPVPTAAVMGAGLGGLQQGLMQSQRAMNEYQQGQGEQIKNQLLQTQLPLTQERAKLSMQQLQDPAYRDWLLGKGPPPGLANTTNLGGNQIPGVGDRAREGGDQARAGGGGVQPTAAPGQGQPQQLPDVVKAAFESLPDDNTRNMVATALTQNNVPPEAWPTFMAIGHGESGWNLKVADARENNGSYSIGPTQVNSSHIGEGGLTEAQLRDPAININRGAQIFNAAWHAAGGDPVKAMNAYASGQPTGPGPQYAPTAVAQLNQWSGVGQGVGGQAGPQPLVSREQALQNYVNLNNQANLAAMMQSRAGALGNPMPSLGDPAELRKTAQMWLSYGLSKDQASLTAQGEIAGKFAAGAPELQRQITRAEESVKPQTNKPGTSGMMYDEHGNRVPFNAPQLEQEVDPKTGQKTWVFNYAPPPGAPVGTPGRNVPVLTAPSGGGGQAQPAVSEIAKDVQDARNEAQKDFVEGGAKFTASMNTHNFLTQMDQAAGDMNAAGGKYATGPYAQRRYETMSKLNDIATTVGMKKPPFDPNKIADYQELVKAANNTGFELSSHYEGHARQAAATIDTAIKSVSGPTNSPEGYNTVSSGQREIAQVGIDLQNFKNQRQRAQGGAGLVGADEDFGNQISGDMYARRAISNADFKNSQLHNKGVVNPADIPYKVNKPEDFNKYLPGTYVVAPDGKTVVQVPDRLTGPNWAPPTPTYLRHDIGAAPQ